MKTRIQMSSPSNPNHLNTARARGEAGKRYGNEVRLGTYIVKIKRSKKVVK